MTRAAIVAEARGWIGTPYRHQASAKGVGCDCLGLVRGVWRAFYGSEAEPVPAYSSDWGQVTGEETMLAAARRHLVEVWPDASCDALELNPRAHGSSHQVRGHRSEPCPHLLPGNVVVFRMHRRAIAKHAGIVVAPGRFVHAYQPMRVAENNLDAWWVKRIAAVFAFPGVTPSPDPSPQGGGEQNEAADLSPSPLAGEAPGGGS